MAFSPQFSNVKLKTETPSAPTSSHNRVPWPTFNQQFHKTTSSTYGSFYQTPLLCMDYSYPPAPVAAGTPVSTQPTSGEITKTRQTRLSVGDKGQLQYVFVEQVSVSEHMHKEEAGPKSDVMVEEGVIVVSSHVGPACCETCLQSVYREAELEHLLCIPLFLPSRRSAEREPFRQALKTPGSRFLQCPCCPWRSPDSCFQTFPSPTLSPPPQTSGLPTFRVHKTAYSPEPSPKPLLFQYLNTYTADWARP